MGGALPEAEAGDFKSLLSDLSGALRVSVDRSTTKSGDGLNRSCGIDPGVMPRLFVLFFHD
jgi:hypothetical protein